MSPRTPKPSMRTDAERDRNIIKPLNMKVLHRVFMRKVLLARTFFMVAARIAGLRLVLSGASPLSR